jgi:mono/diheme cytochrome c family protein
MRVHICWLRRPYSRNPNTMSQEMFKTYCAACHGLEGKGNGPAAPALKKEPANLMESIVNSGIC